MLLGLRILESNINVHMHLVRDDHIHMPSSICHHAW